MADPIGRRLVLSAQELRSLTNWPESMIEDYLAIVEQLREVTVEANDNEEGNTDRFQANTALIAELQSAVAQLRAKVNGALSQGSDTDLSGHREAAINRGRERDLRSFYPAKGAAVKLEGQGGSDPTIISRYNIASVTRTGTGVYEVTLTQNECQGVDIVSEGFLVDSSRIASATCIVDTVPTAPNQYIVTVYELGVSGASVTKTPVDIAIGDYIDLVLLISINDRPPKG